MALNEPAAGSIADRAAQKIDAVAQAMFGDRLGVNSLLSGQV
jgi:hypothetical protein